MENKTTNMKTNKTSRKAGFTLVEIMIVVAIIGLLAAIAIPNFLQARSTAQMNACINNLRQIDSAIQQWALETGQGASATVTGANIQPFMGRGSAGALPVARLIRRKLSPAATRLWMSKQRRCARFSPLALMRINCRNKLIPG